MQLATVKQTEHRLARAWYVMYPLDAYALGPFRFREPVDANEAVEQAETQFGEKPKEAWPDGEEIEVEEYVYEVSVPEEDREMCEK